MHKRSPPVRTAGLLYQENCVYQLAKAKAKRITKVEIDLLSLSTHGFR